MRSLMAAAFLLTASLPALAEDEVDPIDAALTRCLDTPANQDTEGMIQCFGTAYEAWDKALNEAYRDAMEGLDAAQRDRLKDSQRKWLAYRDAEDDFSASLVTPQSGSIVRVIINQVSVDLVKARVLALRAYFAQ
jgi:uncharacterized protein YecT (DUF1311 family)